VEVVGLEAARDWRVAVSSVLGLLSLEFLSLGVLSETLEAGGGGLGGGVVLRFFLFLSKAVIAL